MAGEIDLQALGQALKAELDLVSSTFRDKGGRRFSRAFVLAGLFGVFAYFGVYLPPQKKIARLTREIEAAKALSEASTQYRDIRDQLAVAYAALPQIQDRDQWLSNAMIDSLRADNLTPDSFRPVNETELSSLIFQSSIVQLSIRFDELYAWLMRLESAKPLMHVKSLEVHKRAEPLGWNNVTCEVMTMLPKKRFN